MKIAFYLIAAAMVAVALALLLVPLLREGRRHGRPRGVFALALGIALLLPLGAGALYLHVGTPIALDGVPVNKPLDFQQALAELRAHLKQQPGDAQAWALLAQATSAMKRPDEASDAWNHVLQIDPNSVAAMVGWAESDSMARSDHRISDHAIDLLHHALELQPDNQRGLWLLGIGQFQRAQYADAASTWRILEPLLQPGSTVAKAVAEQIAKADREAGIKPGDEPAPAPAASQGTALKVEVSLAPSLKDKLRPGDQLYVYARAVSGPPMPLAVAKLAADTLPATVTLTDAMAMTPQLKLSSVARVVVSARISHSGQPIAQPGDLEGSAGIVDTDRKTPIAIAIDKVH